MSDVYVTCNVSPCTVVHTIDLPPFNIDTEGGALIAAAIAAVWVVGWSFRMIIRASNVDGVSKTESE